MRLYPSGALSHSLVASVASRRRSSVAGRDLRRASRAARLRAALASADSLRPARTPSSHAHSLRSFARSSTDASCSSTVPEPFTSTSEPRRSSMRTDAAGPSTPRRVRAACGGASARPARGCRVSSRCRSVDRPRDPRRGSDAEHVAAPPAQPECRRERDRLPRSRSNSAAVRRASRRAAYFSIQRASRWPSAVRTAVRASHRTAPTSSSSRFAPGAKPRA